MDFAEKVSKVRRFVMEHPGFWFVGLAILGLFLFAAMFAFVAGCDRV
jgi:hypothetical protein